MSEKMKEFIDLLVKDEAMRKRMEVCKSPDEAFAIASEAVSGLEFGDFTESMKKLKDYAEKLKEGGELSEEDLELVAGGLYWEGDALSFGVLAAIVVASAAAI